MGMLKKFLAEATDSSHPVDHPCGGTRGNRLRERAEDAAANLKSGGAICGKCGATRWYGTCGCPGRGR